MVKIVTIVKTRVNKVSADSGGSSKVKSVTEATDVANVVMANARK